MADSKGYLAGAGAGLFGALGEYLGGAAKRQQDAADAEAARKSDWEDFVTKSNFQQDLQNSAAERAAARNIKSQETLFDYENRAKALGELAYDPDFGPTIKKVLANDPANPPTDQEKEQYNAYREASGYTNTGQLMPKATSDRLQAAKLPVGTYTTLLGQHQTNKDILDQRKATTENVAAETGLHQAETGNIEDAPWKLSTQEHTKSEIARDKDNVTARSFISQADKAIATHQSQIAAIQARKGGPRVTQQQGGAFDMQIVAHQKEIDRLNGIKDGIVNGKRAEGVAQLSSSKNPGAADLSQGLDEGIGPSQEDRQALAAPVVAGAIQGSRRTGPLGLVGQREPSPTENPIVTQLKSIPMATQDPSKMEDGKVYNFPAGFGVYHKKTGTVTKLNYLDLVKELGKGAQ